MTELRYQVTANRLNLRSGPALEAGVTSVLARGQLVEPMPPLEDSWWKVRVLPGGAEGYVARRYLAALSAAATPAMAAANAVLWSRTTAADGVVGYKLGGKHSSQGAIDCSGWVAEITAAAFAAINANAAPEVVFDKADAGVLNTHSDGIVSGIEARTGLVLHGPAIVPEALREGMLIGLNFGEHSWEQNTPPRVYGIDHIVQLMRSPDDGQLWISQSSSSGNGVNRQVLATWLQAQQAVRAANRMHAVDPFLMADRQSAFVRSATETARLSAALPPVPPPPPGTPHISEAAFELVKEFEISSQAEYNRRLIHPTWPHGDSGVTIGIGHDLGYTTPEAFDRNWPMLPADVRSRLKTVIGKKAAAARDALAGVADIVVPWSAAEQVYRAIDVPEAERKTTAAVPNCELLPADCFGVLVSLTFNRGASYTKAKTAADKKDRFREMRAIRAAMMDRHFEDIPDLIRSMKRLWMGTVNEKGLSRRREAEAVLFATGLKALSAPPPTPVSTGLPSEVVSQATGEEDFDNADPAAVSAAARGPTADEAAEAARIAQSRVIWASDDLAIDYAHLEARRAPGSFSFTPDDLARLCAANDFPVEEAQGPVLFALRGCGIIDASDSWETEVVLLDRRPDHHTARCVLGVWDRAAGKIAVFPGSTVPNAQAMVGWRRDHKAGNMLPTGLYRYITGAHNGRPGCFLLRKTATSFRTVVVRRSSNDLRYERGDTIDVCAPGDNIHPTFFQTTEGFSSVGCQTVVGSASKSGVHTGPWAKFRALAGLSATKAKDGVPYLYVLLTGAEAAMASAYRREGKAPDTEDWANLRRLRFGSRSDAVSRLQAQLGIPAPDRDFGPATAERLCRAQQERFEGRCDGIYSPDLDEVLSWKVIG